MKIYLFFLALIFTLSGCYPTYKYISISHNETPTITTPLTAIDFLDQDSIPEMDSYEVTNIIEDLDSLQHYLLVNDKDCYDISYDTNSFKLKIRDDLPIHPSFYYSIPNILSWEFPKKIIDISGQGKVYLNRNNRTLVIYKSKSNYITAEEKVDIILSFSHDSIPSMIKHPFTFKRVGATMELIPGFGFSQINGDASNSMKGAGFLSWSLTGIFNRISIAPRLAIIEGELTNTIIGLEDYENFTNQNLELGLGYELLNHTYFNFTPILYGGRNRLEFYSEVESIESKFINGGFNYSLGASFGLKIDPFFRKKVKREALKDQYFYFKVDGGWYPNYFQKSMSIDGSVNYLTFAISGYLAVDNILRKVNLKDK